MANTGALVVTGATGFVGSRLTQRLVAEGYEVHILVRPNSNMEQLEMVKEHLHIHFLKDSVEWLADLFRQIRPQAVIHLASYFVSDHQTKDIKELINSNIYFPTQLVEAMTQAGVNRLINTGTSWQHYVNEPYNPVNLYASTKQAFEDIVRYYVEARALQVIHLKLFDTYGPNDPRTKLFHLLEKASEGSEPLEMSPGEQLLDLVHIDDVVEAYVLSLARLLSDQVKQAEDYAVTSGKPISLRDFVNVFSKVTDKVLAIHFGGRPYRNREVMLPWSHGHTVPGWEPRISLEEGIRKSVR